ncbi:hypothetical protein M2318_000046 [Metapseudomonas resinovorans]
MDRDEENVKRVGLADQHRTDVTGYRHHAPLLTGIATTLV